MSKSATSQTTPNTENETPNTENDKQPELMINNNQLAGIDSLRTDCNLPGAQDIEALENRLIALNWLYRLSGRTNGIYTNLWKQYQAKLAAAKFDL